LSKKISLHQKRTEKANS